MIDVGVIRGSKEQAKELIIGTDTVYVHSNIKPIETDDGSEVYQYNEFQYTKDEYIRVLSEKNTSLENQMESTQEVIDFLLFSAE